MLRLAAHLLKCCHSSYHDLDQQAFLSRVFLLSFGGYHLKAGPEILSRLASVVLCLTELNILETAALSFSPSKLTSAHFYTFLACILMLETALKAI